MSFSAKLSKQPLHRMPQVKHNAKEYRSLCLNNNCHKICLSGPFGIFCFTSSLADANNKKRHHYPPIPHGPSLPRRRFYGSSFFSGEGWKTSSPKNACVGGYHGPCSSKSRFFLAYWLYLSTVSTFLKYLLGISPSGRNPCGGNNTIVYYNNIN